MSTPVAILNGKWTISTSSSIRLPWARNMAMRDETACVMGCCRSLPNLAPVRASHWLIRSHQMVPSSGSTCAPLQFYNPRWSLYSRRSSAHPGKFPHQQRTLKSMLRWPSFSPEKECCHSAAHWSSISWPICAPETSPQCIIRRATGGYISRLTGSSCGICCQRKLLRRFEANALPGQGEINSYLAVAGNGM